jgi:SsrA-binding protein
MSLAQNKKAYFNYEILEKIEAGLELLGLEVKSIKLGRGVLDGSHITVRGNEAFVIGMQIPPYQASNTPEGYDPNRNRKLLLTKEELKRLVEIENQKGLTIVPLSMYNKGRKLKLEIGIARGKKKFDKRETLKKRDFERNEKRNIEA